MGASCLGIDLDLADGASGREDRPVHLVVLRDKEPVLDVVGQDMSCGFLGELEEVEAAIGAGCREAAPVNATWSAVVSSRRAAIRLPIAMRPVAAIDITVAA